MKIGAKPQSTLEDEKDSQTKLTSKTITQKYRNNAICHVTVFSVFIFAGIFTVLQEQLKKRFISNDFLLSSPYVFNWASAIQEKEQTEKSNRRANHLWTVDRRSNLSLLEFWDIYDAKWPVIITDVVPLWPAFNWTKEFLVEHYGKQRVIMKTVTGELQHATSSDVLLEVFAQNLPESSQEFWNYIEDELFLLMRPELQRDIGENLYTEENFFNLFPEDIRPWDCMFLWGTAFSRSPLHIDPYNWTGLSAVLYGKKRWKLFPPGQDDLLEVNSKYKCGFPLECIKYNSHIDAFAEDSEKYTKVKKADYLEVDQYPGELLIIPTGWLHQAFNVEETLALSMQVMNRNNYLVVLEEIIKGGSINRKNISNNLGALPPADQVKSLLSLIPTSFLQKGKEVTENLKRHLSDGKN